MRPAPATLAAAVLSLPVLAPATMDSFADHAAARAVADAALPVLRALAAVPAGRSPHDFMPRGRAA